MPAYKAARSRASVGSLARRTPRVLAAMATFQDWVAELPAAVKEHLNTVGLVDAELVTDSVTPQFFKSADGAVVQKSVDIVFLETIMDAVSEVKPGTAAAARTIKFYKRCFAAVEAPQRLPRRQRCSPWKQRTRRPKSTTSWVPITVALGARL